MNRYTLPTLLLSATPLAADPPRVVTDIAPVHSLVAAVMGDLAEPELLLPQGADPHAFQMRPSQMRALSQADLVFWVGAELTPWLERALTGVSSANPIALLDVPGTILREADHTHSEEDHEEEGHDDHDETDEHANHDHDEADEHDAHAHDPHAWLSPENGAVWLERISKTLVQHDPENADLYLANTASALKRLQQVESEIEALLAPVRDHGYIVFHDAYGYFSDHYDLSSLGAVRESDSAPPSAARLAEISNLLSSGKVHCAFADATEGQDMMRDIVEGTEIGFGVLDPSGASLMPGPDLYFQLLRSQADDLSVCLGGADS